MPLRWVVVCVGLGVRALGLKNGGPVTVRLKCLRCRVVGRVAMLVAMMCVMTLPVVVPLWVRLVTLGLCLMFARLRLGICIFRYSTVVFAL